MTQQQLAERIGIKPPELSQYLRCKRPVPENIAVRLAKTLELPEEQVLLAAAANRSQTAADRVSKRLRIARDRARGKEQSEEMRQASARHIRSLEQEREEFLLACDRFRQLLKGCSEAKAAPLEHKRDFVSLEDFPNLSDGRWTVIMGDRRERPPEGVGDVVVLPVSSTDMMYLPALKLPADAVVHSDKIVRVASEDDLKKMLTSNLLVVGSPAVSLAAREILRKQGATFLFNIGEETYETEDWVYKTVYGGVPEDQQLDEHILNRFFEQEEVKGKIDDLLADFRKNGFVDPVDYNDIRGRAIPRSKDYGMIALASNPWSPKHLACLCAGIHGGGTAGALKMLSQREKFEERPWGGVFFVSLRDQAHWERRFRYLNPQWETHPYDPVRYLSELSNMMVGVREKDKKFEKVVISDSLLDRVYAFASKLAAGHAGPFTAD